MQNCHAARVSLRTGVRVPCLCAFLAVCFLAAVDVFAQVSRPNRSNGGANATEVLPSSSGSRDQESKSAQSGDVSPRKPSAETRPAASSTSKGNPSKNEEGETTETPLPTGRDAVPAADAPEDSLDAGIPDFHLARLSLDGEVTGDRALITASVDVDVNRADAQDGSDEFHDVPLRFSQAHFLSKEYSGPGKDGPVVNRPVEDGLVWRFTGHGTHHLVLKLWVPVRQSPAGRQMVLSLPTMPPGFDAQLKLKVPGPPVVIRANRELTVLSNERANDANEITADVRGTRLDMTWNEPPEVQKSFLQSTSSITLRRQGDRVEAIAEQVLIPESVGVKEVEIKLPDGFELDELSGSQIKGHEPILGRNGWRKINLRETSGERIDLVWVLSAPFPSNGGTLQFDGLDVPEARGQVGRIVLQDFPGHQLVPRPGQFVRRVPSAVPQTAEAFEFTKQPFRISWDVQRVTPKFSVRPRHLLFVGLNQLVVESRFRIQTDAGSLDQAEIAWESGAVEGWRLDTNSFSEGVVIPPNGDQFSQKGRVSVAWKSPQTGTFELKSRFVKPLSDDISTQRIQLPEIRGGRSHASEVLVAAEDELETTITAAEGEQPTRLPFTGQRSEGIDPSILGQVQFAFAIDPVHPHFELAWRKQARQITADAELETRQAADGRIHVQQTVHFEARYGRISTLRFQIPKSLAVLIPETAADAAIRLTIDGQPSPVRIREGILESTLTEPKLGNLLLTLEFSLPSPPPKSSNQTCDVPVLSSLETAYESVRLRIPEGEPLRVPLSASGWQPIPTSPDATVWVTTSETHVPLSLDTDQSASPRFRIERAFHRSRFDNSGRIEGICELHWIGEVRNLPVQLPPGSELLGAVFNGSDLIALPGHVLIDSAQPDQYQFRLPPASEGAQLALWYKLETPAPFSHRDLRTVVLPQFPKDVSVARTIWELELPPGRHLFLGPKDLTTEHEWRRSGLLWSRVPTHSYLEERAEATTEARAMFGLHEPGSVYAFSSIGPMESARFQSMTRSLILMLGAGLTLALGFLFWSLPVTRNMLGLLLIAFGISLLSLWFLEPIQLLLQPAALGAVLAILASWIDLKARRSQLPVLARADRSASAPIPHLAMTDGAATGRGSSVARPRSQPNYPTAIYQPGSSEAGRP